LYNKGFLKLNKALYDLKQAGRHCNETLTKTRLKLNFRRLNSEPCIFVKNNNEKEIVCILAVYVDDILLAKGNNVC
jgi:hypothetical protein